MKADQKKTETTQLNLSVKTVDTPNRIVTSAMMFNKS